MEGKFPVAMRTLRPLLRSRAAPGPAPPDSQSHPDTGHSFREATENLTGRIKYIGIKLVNCTNRL